MALDWRSTTIFMLKKTLKKKEYFPKFHPHHRNPAQ
jgi:hypothetical protein